MSSTELGSVVLGSASLNHLRLDRRTAGYWRATFDQPAINTVTATSTAIEEFDVGARLVPSGGPTARLPRLVHRYGRRRAAPLLEEPRTTTAHTDEAQGEAHD